MYIILTKTDFELKIFTREHLATLVTYPFFYGLDFFRRCPELPHVSKIVLVPDSDTVLGHSAPIVFRSLNQLKINDRKNGH